MRHEQIDVGPRKAISVQNPSAHLFHVTDCKLEDSLTVLFHKVQAATVSRLAGMRLPPAGMQAQARQCRHVVLEIENAALAVWRVLDDHGACAVTEQHARRAIGVIDDARHHVGTDHERVTAAAGGDQVSGGRQRVSES